MEFLELRTLLSAAFDMTGLTALRADPTYSAINGQGIAVAILDTGIYGQHPDLVKNVEVWFDAVKYGNQWATNPGDTNIADSFDPDGHGSHVAGTAASSNPAIGVATGAKIVDVRVLPASNETQPSWDPLLTGLEWVLQNDAKYNIRVVNMSLGDPYVNDNTLPASDDYSTVIQSLENAGVTVVSAAGNGYTGYQALGESSPAIWSTLAVGNVWQNNDPGGQLPVEGIDPLGNWVSVETSPQADNLQAASQRSTLPNMVCAPGSEIYSTWNGANGLLYNTIMGTSQASPLVTGMVALMQDAAFTFGGRYLTPTEVQTIARNSADHIVDAPNPNTERFPVATNSLGQLVQTGPIQDSVESGLTYDRVNIYRAVQAVRALVTQSSTTGGANLDTNNTIASSTSLPALNATTPDVAQGNIGTDGQVQVGANDVDLYKLVLSSPGQITIALLPLTGGQAFSPVVRLFDSTGTQLAEQTGSPSAYPTLTTSSTLAAGTYYFGISSQANTLYNIVNGSDIAAGGSTGDYQATVSLSNPDPNGVAQGAVQVDMTQADAFDPDLNVPAEYFPGTIGSDPNLVNPSLPRIQIGPTDVDMFKMVAPDTGVLTVNIHSQDVYGTAGIDSFVLMYDQNLTLVGYNDDRSRFNTDSFLQVNVTEGQVYYVAVTTYGTAVTAQGTLGIDPSTPYGRHSTTGQTGSYDLYLSFDNGDKNGTVFSATPFQGNATNNVLSGVIGSDFGTPLLSYSANGGNKDVDFYSYSPTQSGLLEIAATSPDHSMMSAVTLWQYDSTANTVSKIADTSGATAALDYPVTSGQTYYVSVTGQGNQGFNWYAVASGSGGQTGNYQLRIVVGPSSDATALNNNSIQNGTPTPIGLNQPIPGDIGMDGPLVVGPTDVDLYSFTPAQDSTYSIGADASRTDSADTFLRLFDSTGHELAYNDNLSASSASSLIVQNLTGGQTYYIGVDGAGAGARNYNPLTGAGAAAGSTGTYTLTVSLAADFNGDGQVNGQDFLTWQTHYPTSGGATRSMGDANGDGLVNGQDFLIWQTSYHPLVQGSSVSQLTAPSAPTAAPPPVATAALPGAPGAKPIDILAASPNVISPDWLTPLGNANIRHYLGLAASVISPLKGKLAAPADREQAQIAEPRPPAVLAGQAAPLPDAGRPDGLATDELADALAGPGVLVF
jgi:subtilisin family serine protease